MDARQWLETVFTPALQWESLAQTSDAEILRGQLCALHDCGVLSDAAFDDARARLDEAKTKLTRFGPHVASIVASGAPDGPVPVVPEPGVELRRVIPVGTTLATIDDMPFVLTSIEMWDHQIDVLLAGLPNAAVEQRMRQHDVEFNDWMRNRREGRSVESTLSAPTPLGHDFPRLDLRLHDDFGTEYRSTGGGNRGGRHGQWRLHQTFAPGMPDAASRLMIEVADRDGHIVRRLELTRYVDGGARHDKTSSTAPGRGGLVTNTYSLLRHRGQSGAPPTQEGGWRKPQLAEASLNRRGRRIVHTGRCATRQHQAAALSSARRLVPRAQP